MARRAAGGSVRALSCLFVCVGVALSATPAQHAAPPAQPGVPPAGRGVGLRINVDEAPESVPRPSAALGPFNKTVPVFTTDDGKHYMVDVQLGWRSNASEAQVASRARPCSRPPGSACAPRCSPARPVSRARAACCPARSRGSSSTRGRATLWSLARCTAPTKRRPSTTRSACAQGRVCERARSGACVWHARTRVNAAVEGACVTHYTHAPSLPPSSVTLSLYMQAADMRGAGNCFDYRKSASFKFNVEGLGRRVNHECKYEEPGHQV